MKDEEYLVNYDRDRNVVTIKVPGTGYMKNPYELDLDTKKTIKKSFDFWWDHLSESKRWFKDNPRIQEELAWIEAWVTDKGWEKYN
tara:strand:+ start:210 stop:467 length:258 start_codon:yes stop_codon:yes gene_type:complete